MIQSNSFFEHLLSKVFISCSDDRVVKIWDSTTFQCLRSLTHENEVALNLELVNKYAQIASASADSINVWTFDGQYLLSYSEEEIKMYKI
jgi:WD40 repeat protein